MKFLKLFEDFNSTTTQKILIGDIPLVVIVAETEKQQQKGYMFSDGPKDGEGMLFTYPNEQILSFWMKNVSVPLDILFFNSNLDLVDSQSMFPYQNEEETFYNSKKPAKYAIEVPHGWINNIVKDNNLKLKL